MSFSDESNNFARTSAAKGSTYFNDTKTRERKGEMRG